LSIDCFGGISKIELAIKPEVTKENAMTQNQENQEVKYTKRNEYAKERMTNHELVDCWLCRTAKETLREATCYCLKCNRGFCNEHGNFANNHGTCLICGARKEDKE
jgi:hypothetical protein